MTRMIDRSMEPHVLLLSSIIDFHPHNNASVVKYSEKTQPAAHYLVAHLIGQWGSEHEEQPGATVLWSNSATGSESQSRMGRMFDGVSARLDRVRWPALPGQELEAWEPVWTVTGRQPHQNPRLKALGNAIVSY